MKKIIALLLALTLCVGLFAGCEKPADTSGLEGAATYLEAMYKQEEEITAVDYTRVSVVMIDGVTYTVTWTCDKDSIKLVAGDKMTTVELPDTLEDINYTLTATVSDANGNTKTVTFKRTIPAAAGLPTEIADGTYVIAFNGLTMSSLAQDKGYGYPTANTVTIADGAVTGHFKADVLTIKNVEGGITIQDAHGRYFYLKGTYNSFNVDANMPAEGAVWKLLKNGDNYIVVNVMNGKTLAYSTSYKSWGAYAELTDDYNTMLAIVPATAPAEDPVVPPVEGGEENKDPSADSTLSVKDAIDLGASKEHNTYTEGKYYVTGEITEIYNEQYGNMKIKDAAGNILTIYGTFSADGATRFDAMEVKPAVGDTITVYGIIGQYNNTPQIKNGWIVKIGAEEPAGNTLTVEQAINMGAAKEHNNYTEEKYYVVGEITEIYNEQYGNMKIKDAEGNILTVYGTWSADGNTRFDALEKKPAVGDIIKVYGIIGQYNGTPQMKNGWIVEITGK